MKHCQSKCQSPLLIVVAGFLAGLAAWKQMFLGANAVSAAHLLEAAGRKKLGFVQAGPTFQTI